jgi:hypothetical protein
MALPTVEQIYNQAMTSLQGYGNSQKQELHQAYRDSVGQGMQQLVSSGLAGTSAAPSMRMGYMKQYMQALNSLNDQLTKSKLGAQQTFGLGGLQVQQAQEGLEQSRQQIANQMTLGLGNLNLDAQRVNMSRQSLQYEQAQRQTQMGYQMAMQPQARISHPGSAQWAAQYYN